MSKRLSMDETMGAAIAMGRNITPIRRDQSIELPEEGEEPFVPKWRHYLAAELGIGVMTKTDHPPPFYVRLQAFGIYVSIIAAIVGGFIWSYNRGDTAGYERRNQEAQMEKLQEEVNAAKAEVNAAKADAADAKKLSIYAARDVDNASGHTKSNKKEDK